VNLDYGSDFRGRGGALSIVSIISRRPAGDARIRLSRLGCVPASKSGVAGSQLDMNRFVGWPRHRFLMSATSKGAGSRISQGQLTVESRKRRRGTRHSSSANERDSGHRDGFAGEPPHSTIVRRIDVKPTYLTRISVDASHAAPQRAEGNRNSVKRNGESWSGCSHPGPGPLSSTASQTHVPCWLA
jgi:hypothetical protein